MSERSTRRPRKLCEGARVERRVKGRGGRGGAPGGERFLCPLHTYPLQVEEMPNIKEAIGRHVNCAKHKKSLLSLGSKVKKKSGLHSALERFFDSNDNLKGVKLHMMYCSDIIACSCSANSAGSCMCTFLPGKPQNGLHDFRFRVICPIMS